MSRNELQGGDLLFINIVGMNPGDHLREEKKIVGEHLEPMKQGLAPVLFRRVGKLILGTRSFPTGWSSLDVCLHTARSAWMSMSFGIRLGEPHVDLFHHHRDLAAEWFEVWTRVMLVYFFLFRVFVTCIPRIAVPCLRAKLRKRAAFGTLRSS